MKSVMWVNSVISVNSVMSVSCVVSVKYVISVSCATSVSYLKSVNCDERSMICDYFEITTNWAGEGG